MENVFRAHKVYLRREIFIRSTVIFSHNDKDPEAVDFGKSDYRASKCFAFSAFMRLDMQALVYRNRLTSPGAVAVASN